MFPYLRNTALDIHNCNELTFHTGGVRFTLSAVLEPFIEQFMPRSLRLSFPAGVPTDLRGLTLEEAEEKNRASSKPLPLTAGLLIQTIKALALSNPCFTFTVGF